MLYTSGPILTLSSVVNIWSDIDNKQPTRSFPVNTEQPPAAEELASVESTHEAADLHTFL